MMWLMSTVTHFLTDVSQGTSPNFSKGWCTRELINVIIIDQGYVPVLYMRFYDSSGHIFFKMAANLTLFTDCSCYR